MIPLLEKELKSGDCRQARLESYLVWNVPISASLNAAGLLH
jgi:hypothetical protein